jgi:hypothetical protein
MFMVMMLGFGLAGVIILGAALWLRRSAERREVSNGSPVVLFYVVPCDDSSALQEMN